MKNLVAFFLVMSSVSALAAESKNIWDLQYLPEAGTLYGESALSSISGRGKANIGGRTDYEGTQFRQTIGYSFSDKFSLEGSIVNMDLELQTNGSSDDTEISGWSDPSIMGKYRLIEDEFRLDVLGGATVKTGDSWENSEGDVNNKGESDFNFTGGPAYFLGLEAGQKQSQWQYSLLALYRRADETTEHSGDETYENEAHNQFMLGAKLLNNLTEKLYLRSSLTAHFIDAYDYEANDGSKDKVAPLTEYRAGTGFLYALSDNVLGNVDATFRKLNVQSGTVDYIHIWMFTIGARYQF